MGFSPQQLERLPRYRERWQRLVLSTEAVDRQTAEDAIRRLYRTLSLPAPQQFLWFDSPLEAAEAAKILQLEPDPELFSRYWGQLVRSERETWERVRGLIVQQSRLHDWEAVLQSLVRNPYGEAAYCYLTGAIRANAPWLPLGPKYLQFASSRDPTLDTKERKARQREEIRALEVESDPASCLREDVDEVEWTCFESCVGTAYVYPALSQGLASYPAPEFEMRRISFGQLARVDFLANECQQLFAPRYLDLVEIGKQVNLWWAFEKVVVVCERPERILRNAGGQLHADDGPALTYRNGWNVWAWKGEPVEPVALTPPDRITFDLIEANRPYKKILVERYGKKRYRAELAEKRRQKPALVLKANLPANANERAQFLRESAHGNLPHYDRYVSGDRAGAWSALCALEEGVRSEAMAADGLAVAYAIMDRARENVRFLLERLERLGYEFEGESPSAPSRESSRDWRKIERKIGTLPLSLRAWWDAVGSVDFTGVHDRLSCRGGAENPTLGTLLTDPLVVYPPEVTLNEFEEAGEPGDEFRQAILAPDRYHKHEFSGGDPYGIALPCNGADGLVLGEPNGLGFVDYLRLCFRYGGFPGFVNDESKIPQKEMRVLTEGLLEI